jgi:hypothetical protein
MNPPRRPRNTSRKRTEKSRLSLRVEEKFGRNFRVSREMRDEIL